MFPKTLSATCSEAEFLTLPESHDRIELIDGEVLLSPPPSYEHQLIVLHLAGIFRAWADAHPPAAVGLSPLDVRLGAGRIVQPDLFLVECGIPRSHSGPIDTVPTLVVEVSSDSRVYDRIAKRHLYAEAGVPEYWVIDRRERQVEVIAGLPTLETVAQGRLSSRVCPGLEIEVASLF